MTTLVELCAGSAALARHAFGLGAIVGYQGGKDGYAAAIAREWGLLPDGEALLSRERDEAVLVDPGVWGLVWEALRERAHGSDLIAIELGALEDGDARALWRRAVEETARALSTRRAATARDAALALLRIAGTHGGAERGGFKGPHCRRPSVDGFIPSRATLCRRALALDRMPRSVWGLRADAREITPRAGAWCYIDPPYAGATGYLNDLPRADVVALARRWREAGARVAVSEREPIPELLADGWRVAELSGDRVGQGRKDARSAVELLHVSP